MIPNSAIGAANGVAPLDAASTIPNQYLNISGLQFLGGWNASTNFPALIDGSGETGDFYKATTAGTHDFGNGAYTFAVGDWVMYAGGTWQRIGVQEQVQSVNGKVGAVVITASDAGALPTSYVPAWADVSGKPTTATRWPTYAEVTGKPRNYVHRGTISPPIAAGRRLGGIKEIARATATNYNSWSTSSGYDVYGTIGAERITPPGWAKYIRVTGTIVMQHMSLDSHVWASVTATSASNVLTNVAEATARGCGNPSFPSVSIDTGVHQIDPGSYYHIRLYHNDPNPRSTQGGTWISVEYFETIP